MVTFSSNTFTPMRADDRPSTYGDPLISTPKPLTHALASGFLSAFMRETESESLRLRKIAAALTQVAGILFTLFWLVLFHFLRLEYAARINLVYNSLCVLNLAIFAVTKNLALNLNCAFGLVTCYVVAIQAALGGMHESGLVIIWGILAPVCSSMLLGRQSGVIWLIIFVAAMAASAIYENVEGITKPLLPPGFSLFNTILNVGSMSVLAVASIYYLVGQLDQARERADRLLLGMLPVPIAQRLKKRPEGVAEHHPEVTILFADIVGFTRLAARADAIQLVAMLNALFSHFDKLAERHGLEKIKTIGDAYMVVGGLPNPRPDHAVAVAKMALDMLAELQARQPWTDEPLQLRIGINTGPVIAGVIGKRKFSYDIWGDAVNVASRMESNGIAGQIQLTEHVRADQTSF